MKVSIWWVVMALYVGVFVGIFINVCCMRFKERGGKYGHF